MTTEKEAGGQSCPVRSQSILQLMDIKDMREALIWKGLELPETSQPIPSGGSLCHAADASFLFRVLLCALTHTVECACDLRQNDSQAPAQPGASTLVQSLLKLWSGDTIRSCLAWTASAMQLGWS